MYRKRIVFDSHPSTSTHSITLTHFIYQFSKTETFHFHLEFISVRPSVVKQNHNHQKPSQNCRQPLSHPPFMYKTTNPPTTNPSNNCRRKRKQSSKNADLSIYNVFASPRPPKVMYIDRTYRFRNPSPSCVCLLLLKFILRMLPGRVYCFPFGG